MEKRTILALALVALVIILTPKLFPGSRVAPVVGQTGSEQVGVAQPVQDSLLAQRIPPQAKVERDTSVSAVSNPGVAAAVEQDAAEQTVIESSVSSFATNSSGASLQQVSLRTFRDLSAARAPLVTLTAGATPLLSYRIVSTRDTIPLAGVIFQTTREGDGITRYDGVVGDSPVTIRYVVKPDSFIAHVSGTIGRSQTTGDPRFLLIDLPETLRSFEADTVDDQRHLAFAYYTKAGDARSLPFGKLDPGEVELVPGPLTWVVTKDKYFLVGLLSDGKDPAFAEFSAEGGIQSSRTETHAKGTIVHRLSDGAFAFDVYAGPQQWRRLSSLGRDFENSNPYGGFLQPVVQPFATIVMKILLWMRENLRISYGWVLVIFGIAVRLILWPLNQKGMRASMKMQRIQPELNEIQKRYKSDPPKMQAEMMRVYKEHDMSPFSTFAGCLPLFLPLPILFALFFVFQNTIEFRGVPFLWFPDISQKDPFYIVPLTMGVSMFALSWISMRNTPPNPQTKAMTYIFPVMMTVLFANFPSGLNMYYTIQNLAALPQQWLIANERAKTSAKS
ncbi:MAG: Membrane protein insertase YidC [Gemmatimonadaceae bacterium]|nr:Membrane protein insertase YidC [Gemmatimonadaceae bacterium]